MPLSAAEREAKRKAKLKTKGKVLFQAWVTQAQAERIRALTYHATSPPRRKRRKSACACVVGLIEKVVPPEARENKTP